MRDLLVGIWASPHKMPVLSVRGWEALLAQAWHSGLIARLAQHFADRGWLAEVPPQPRAYLEGALRAATRQAQEVRWEVECVRLALAPLETPIVLLKGAAYVQAQLPPARGRLFSDVDFLVPRERLDEVEHALFAAGWYVESRDAYDLSYYRRWSHELPPMKHAQRGTALDVHHTITLPTSRFRVDASKLFPNCRAVGADGLLQVLGPADMVIHSAVHLFQAGEFGRGLRDLLDMNDLVQHHANEPGFWEGLVARARELKLGEPLWYAMAQLSRLFGTQATPAAAAGLEQLQPGWLRRTVMQALLAEALRPEHPSCDGPFTPPARWLLYVRSHYLAMPLRLVMPHLLRKAWMKRFPKVAPKTP